MKPNSIFFTIFILIISINSKAQVGIGTENPREEIALDIEGNLNVSNRIYLGGTNINQGSFGDEKTSITSNGATNATAWKKIQVPEGYGESFTVSYMNTYYDEAGINPPASGTGTYSLDESLGTNWVEIPGLRNNFTIYKNINKVNFIFQTTAQIVINDSSNGSASFACGLFLNTPAEPNVFRLKGVRNGIVQGPTGSFNIVNLNATLENLSGSLGGNVYESRIACRGRNLDTVNQFGIGKAMDTSLLNQEMTQSTLNVFVLEPWN